MVPKRIDVKNDSLYLEWNDNTVSEIKLKNLKYYCPCAICTKEREENGDSYIPIFTKEQITISSINLSGKYAINIIWKDGHNTGYYEFPYLKKLSEIK